MILQRKQNRKELTTGVGEMSNSNFDWTSFLLGFAIALWIALVVLFLTKDDETTSHTHPTQIVSVGTPLWVPSGDQAYMCTNNDQGGGIVIDQGGGIVEDQGGGVIEDGAPKVPVPTSAQLGVGVTRGYHEYQCSPNDQGGGIVEDSTGRTVAVGMPADTQYDCRVTTENDAVVVDNITNKPIDIDQGGGIVEDQGGGIVVDTGIPPVSGQTGVGLVYCMVARPDSSPIIVPPIL